MVSQHEYILSKTVMSSNTILLKVTYANNSSKLIMGRPLENLLSTGNRQKREQQRRAAANSWKEASNLPY